MKNINSHYFIYSLNNADDILDFSSPEGTIVISKNEFDKQTELSKKNDQLIDLITTYQTLKDNNSFSEDAKKTAIDEIIKILDTTENINYSPFCVYFQVLSFSYSAYKGASGKMTQTQKENLIEQIVQYYIKNRHNMYKYHGYSNEVLQVMSDAASSRREGVRGINKIRKYLDDHGYTKIDNYVDFNRHSKCYLLPDKGDKTLFNTILANHGIKFSSRENRQGKTPDVLIKIGDDIFIVEQKITNGVGGAQNEAIDEIIDFINANEESDNVHYISCLQGNYISTLNKTNKSNKEQNQYDEIMHNLNTYLNNYFVNENGLEILLNDYNDKIDAK